MKRFKEFLAEGANLAPAELYKYSWRVEMFLDKFKNGHPLELTNGKEIVLKYNEEQEFAIRSKKDPGKIQFVGLDNRTYKLGDFAKSSEFGGGGSGAGADVTKLTESAQAVYCAARWNGSTQYTDKDLDTGFKSASVDSELSAIKNELPPAWRKSCMLGAERLYSVFGKKHYTFHRGSEWVDKLEGIFKKLNSKDKVFANLNKWSPADIYMVSAVGKSMKLEEATNIIELNNMLAKAHMDKDIVGVSLKLLKKDAKMTVYNIGKDKPIVEFDSFTTGNKGFFGGKDVYVYFTLDGKIQFRTFPNTFQGEIKGKNANNGKLSYGPINTILRNLKLSTLTDIKKLRKNLETSEHSTIAFFYSCYTKYAKDSVKVSFDHFKETIAEKGLEWQFSKYLGCELIDIITKARKEDEFVTACIQYASSSSDLSAPFIKLE